MSQKYRYAALIRGINVGGNSLIKMTELQKLFELAGLTDISTYIQSGNVIFSTMEIDRGELAHQLKLKVSDLVSSQVRVFLFTQAELKEAAANNPFDCAVKDEEQACHLMFLSSPPDPARRKALLAMEGEEYKFYITDKALYYAYPRTLAANRRNINFEKVLGVAGTSRTWKVVDKLIELLD